jgi:hypothetical protein
MNKAGKVDFEQYFYTFFSWSSLDFNRNYRHIKTLYLKDYLNYCKSIDQEPVRAR